MPTLSVHIPTDVHERLQRYLEKRAGVSPGLLRLPERSIQRLGDDSDAVRRMILGRETSRDFATALRGGWAKPREVPTLKNLIGTTERREALWQERGTYA